jgi:DNA polymerase I-like protein with 3'-5' exonuclease and polymerase domains
MARRLDCSVEEAQKIIWQWNKHYPVFAAWKRGLIAASEAGVQLTTFGGRHLPTLTKHYQAISYVVQGSSTDVFKTMVRRVAGQLRKQKARAELWLPLHDELVLSVPDEPSEIAQALDILAKCMTVEIGGVTVSGTPEVIGRSWRKL